LGFPGVALEGEDSGAGLAGPVQTPAAESLEQFVEPGAFCSLNVVDDLRG
jgi:hypothetical protein